MWFRIFGAPSSILCDNGGEFINDEISDLCEKFNIFHKTSAAESPWSNGLVERHNGVLGGMVNKTMKDTGCSLEVALNWSLAAKNSLATVYGFSPNILVFGRNPNFPNIMINKMPANNSVCISRYLSETLNAMHTARQSFIEHERSERIRRALLRKTRSFSDEIFSLGDMVYFYRNDDICHGPAKIIGVDGSSYLLKHGGHYSRVHACKMRHVPDVDTGVSNQSKSKASLSDPNESPLAPQNETETESFSEVDSYSENQFSPPTSVDGLETTTDHISETLPSPEYTTVQSSKDLPTANSTISYRLNEGSDWRMCTILGRGGKASGSNWHYLNIREDDHDSCMSFKGAQWFQQPTPISIDHEENDVYVLDHSNEADLINDAKDCELRKWSQMKVYQEVPDTGQATISTRWVVTRKMKDGKLVHKARLVARGFEENTDPLQKDSPTCCKDTLRLILCIFASRRWVLHALDVKAAFLQGLPIERELFLKPPKHAKTKNLWQLLQCPYGLADASRRWYLRVVDELTRLGGRQSKYDKAVFTWHDSRNVLIGIVASHVDDFILAGSPDFHSNVVSVMHDVFAIGSNESSSFKYIGVDISVNGSKIELSMSSYASSINSLDIDPSLNKSIKLSARDIISLKRVAGQVNWLVTQCRPDMAYENCLIGNSMKSPTVKDVSFLNKAIRKLKCCNVKLSFQPVNIYKSTIVAFCDASFGSLPNGGSQGAFIIFLIDDDGLYSPLTWQSRRIRRVVKSTIAAECLAAIEAAEASVLIKTMLCEFCGSGLDVDILIYCDNRNIVDCVKTCTSIQDKRLLIDIAVLRDMLSRKEISEIIWIPTDKQLSNCLTKQGASAQSLIKILNNTLKFNFNEVTFQ